MHVIIYLGKDSGLLTYFSIFPSSCAALSRHCSSEHGEEQDKIKSIFSYIALSHQFTSNIENAVSNCYWIWVKLKQMTSAPFSFRWTNFFRALEDPTGKRACLLLTGSSDLPLPHIPTEPISRTLPRYQWSGLSWPLTFPPGAAVGRSLADAL